jgi:choline-sulfatase
MSNKPNILFLMSDEHRADVAGYAGNSIVLTPILDELARTGVVFTNAYTPSPICIPARPCMMAGQLPKTCGALEFGDDLSPFYNTFARVFSEHDYSTVVAGKLHHTGMDVMQGWTQRIGGDTNVSNKIYKNNGAMKKPDPHVDPSLAIKNKWSDTKEVKRAGISSGDGFHRDEYTVLGAEQFINDYFNSPYYDRPGEAPLLLKVSLIRPHYPYLTTEEKFNYYLNRVEPYLNEHVFDHPFLSSRQVKPDVDAEPREIRRATAAYYGMIEELDEHYARVLKALEVVNQNIDDWIIIYTSDHGEMLGQHGIWEKQKFFEASVRVPLIIRYPKRFKGDTVVDQNVNLCDLYATLCDLAGIPIPTGLDSRSLVPLMEGNIQRWNNESISHFGKNYVMIKQDHLKYQYYGNDMPEVLFDLSRNPEETENYLDDSAYSENIQTFRQRRKELGYG